MTSAGRIAAAALAALVIDSVFLWQAAPHFAVAFGLTTIPLVVGIRVIRGFPRSIEYAAATFGAVQLTAAAVLIRAADVTQVTASLVVAAALSATGLAAIGASWLRRRQAAVIEMEPTVRVVARVRVNRRYR